MAPLLRGEGRQLLRPPLTRRAVPAGVDAFAIESSWNFSGCVEIKSSAVRPFDELPPPRRQHAPLESSWNFSGTRRVDRSKLHDVVIT